jgi:hypothetical protein
MKPIPSVLLFIAVALSLVADVARGESRTYIEDSEHFPGWKGVLPGTVKPGRGPDVFQQSMAFGELGKVRQRFGTVHGSVTAWQLQPLTTASSSLGSIHFLGPRCFSCVPRNASNLYVYQSPRQSGLARWSKSPGARAPSSTRTSSPILSAIT